MTSPEPLRLLLVSGSNGPFGALERVLWELATRLPESRFEIAVWLPPDRDLDELAVSLEDQGARVARVAEPRSRFDVATIAAIGAALRKEKPDLLHLHVDGAGMHRGLPALAKLAGVPHLVVTQHGMPASEPWTGLHKADAVTVVCESIADAVSRFEGVPRRQLRLVPNGAEPPDERSELPGARRLRDRLGAGAFRPLWVCAARLEAVKGHDVLIDALETLRARGLDFVVALAGEGGLKGFLERRVADAGLGSHVHFLGPVESLGPVLLAADAVVLPSREEGMPISLLEAMARGRVVVASDVGGVPDVIEHGVHGLLVPPGDAEALAEALGGLHGKADFALRVGQNAADRVSDSLTWAHVVERFEAVYDEVLGLAGFTPESGARGRSSFPR